MYIKYRDELGYVVVEVDEYGIVFDDGYAYFNDGAGKDYLVPVNRIELIVEKEKRL